MKNIKKILVKIKHIGKRFDFHILLGNRLHGEFHHGIENLNGKYKGMYTGCYRCKEGDCIEITEGKNKGSKNGYANKVIKGEFLFFIKYQIPFCDKHFAETFKPAF
jgi:hypothetical protein